MKLDKYAFSILILSIIILAAIVLVQYQDKRTSTNPYTIGSDFLSASQLPPGMELKHFDVTSDEIPPTIGLDVSQDSAGAWEIHATTTNFTYAPEHINGDPIPGEGHIHLYIDNKLIIMLGPWYRLDSLTPGDHLMRVGLFNNDHSAYFVNGRQIEASKTIHASSSLSSEMDMNMK